MNLDFTTIDGLRIRFAASRNPGKPQLILLSPQPQSLLVYRHWWPQLKNDFDVVAVDLPNHGHSQAAKHVTTVSQQGAFFGRILDHFDFVNPHVVGPDVGTPTVLRYMVNTPGRIKSATVGDAGCVWPIDGQPLFRWLCTSRLVYLSILSCGGPIGGRIYTAVANIIGYRNAYPSQDILRDYRQSSTHFGRLRGQIGFLASYPEENPRLYQDLPKITTPVQVLHGQYDLFVAVSNSWRLHKKLPNSRFDMVENAAHYSYEDNPEGYLRRVLDWIYITELGNVDESSAPS
jgi:pimeloyl-ACP methyl ester carboxylesterase